MAATPGSECQVVYFRRVDDVAAVKGGAYELFVIGNVVVQDGSIHLYFPLVANGTPLKGASMSPYFSYYSGVLSVVSMYFIYQSEFKPISIN